MRSQLWSIFLKHLWPLLWPIIRDSMVEVVQDLATWLRQAISDRFDASSRQQQANAEDRARAAQQEADHAATHEERIKAEASAAAWREIAEQLRKDNEILKQQLDETIRLSQGYARKRIDSEAEQNKVQDKVEALESPNDPKQLK